jgi:hypothetical protein
MGVGWMRERDRGTERGGKRERDIYIEIERETDRQTDRQTDRDISAVCVKFSAYFITDLRR